MAVFWEELFIQGFPYQLGVESELFCYESSFTSLNVNCTQLNCTGFDCYKIVLRFWKAFTTAAGVFATFISIHSIVTVTLLFV